MRDPLDSARLRQRTDDLLVEHADPVCRAVVAVDADYTIIFAAWFQACEKISPVGRVHALGLKGGGECQNRPWNVEQRMTYNDVRKAIKELFDFFVRPDDISYRRSFASALLRSRS